MTNWILKAKHWKLFIISFAIPMFIYMLSIGFIIQSVIESVESGVENFDPAETFKNVKLVLFIVFILYSTLWLWFWSLGVGLQQYIPESLRMNTTLFKAFHIIPVIYIIFVCYLIGNTVDQVYANDFEFDPDLVRRSIRLFCLSQLIMIGCRLYVMYFAAKSLMTARLKKKVTFGDYFVEIILLWIYPIGVWIVQPVVNNIVEDHNMENF